MRAQIYEDHVAEVEGVTEIARILQRKLVGKYIPAFNAITGLTAPKKEQLNPYVMKNFLLGISIMLNSKIKEQKH